MMHSEVATLLGYIALTDNRTVGDADIHAWAEVLPPATTLNDAKAAVAEHRRSSRQWLTPFDVVERVAAIRKTRMAAAGEPPFPPDLTVGQEIAWRRHWIEALGEDTGSAADAADARMGITRPGGPLVENAAVMGQIRALAGSKAIA